MKNLQRKTKAKKTRNL